MILTDSKINQERLVKSIIIQPFDEKCLGTNSYDIHLGSTLCVYDDYVLDAKKHNKTTCIEIPENGLIIYPNQLYLGVTNEYTETHAHVPFIEGKSSVGRLGIDIHATAGKGDVGFCGYWTLEISCKIPVRIYAGMPIGQIIYFEISGKVLTPYSKKESAKYSGQGSMPVESMMWKNKF